jgi:hypothetical protein
MTVYLGIRVSTTGGVTNRDQEQEYKYIKPYIQEN